MFKVNNKDISYIILALTSGSFGLGIRENQNSIKLCILENFGQCLLLDNLAY